MVQGRGKLVILLGAAAVAAFPAGARAGSVPDIVRVVRIVSGPSPLDSFRRPQGLFTDPERGTSLIADTGNHRVAVFDSTWRCRGVLEFPAGEPRAMAVDDRGRLFVVDALSPRIHVMTTWGARIREFVPPVPGASERIQPQDLVLGASGNFYVLVGGDRPGLLVLDRRGAPLASLGFGRPGQPIFRGPTALAVDAAERRIAVVDPTADPALHVFDSNLAPLASFGKHGEGEGTLSMAADAAWGPGETLWITDSLRHSISVFNDAGTYLGRIGGFGDGPGQFNYPVGCAFLAPDRLVVLERAGARLQVLEVAVPAAAHAEAALGHRDPGSDGVDSANEQGR